MRRTYCLFRRTLYGGVSSMSSGPNGRVRFFRSPSGAEALVLFCSSRPFSLGFQKSHLVSLMDDMSNASTSSAKTSSLETDADTNSASDCPCDEFRTEGEHGVWLELTAEEVGAMEKTFKRPIRSKSYLTEKERRVFTRMLYDTFYQSDSDKSDDRALLYQASLELCWLEEWAEGLAKQKPADLCMTRDDIRRLVKKSVLERVDLHKPLSYIIGSQPFYGCDITCKQPLLCPRPETEMWTHWLVSTYLKRATRPIHVLDMCCGTGCIGVAIAKHVPLAHVTGVDLLDVAVETTFSNAVRNGIPPERFRSLQSDMFHQFQENRTRAPDDGARMTSAVMHGQSGATLAKRMIAPEYTGSMDVIVANPPYVLVEQYVDLPPSITKWESKMALVGDGFREHRQYLYFQELCDLGAAMLKPLHHRDPALQTAPNLVVEVGLQSRLVASLMERSGFWKDVQVHLDYAQQERWITASSVH